MCIRDRQKAADGSGSATKTIRDTWSGFNEDLSQALVPVSYTHL